LETQKNLEFLLIQLIQRGCLFASDVSQTELRGVWEGLCWAVNKLKVQMMWVEWGFNHYH